jgi:hypothetical protein
MSTFLVTALLMQTHIVLAQKQSPLIPTSRSSSRIVNSSINEIGTNISTVTPVTTAMVLLDDAIQALHEKNDNKALVLLNMAHQVLVSSSSPVNKELTKTGNLGTTQSHTIRVRNTGDVQQIPSNASDFKNHNPNQIRIDFVKVSKGISIGVNYEMKGELTNTGKITLNGLRIHIHWYDKDMNLIGFNNGQNGVYSPKDAVTAGKTISFDFAQSATDFTGMSTFFKLSYDWQ